MDFFSLQLCLIQNLLCWDTRNSSFFYVFLLSFRFAVGLNRFVLFIVFINGELIFAQRQQIAVWVERNGAHFQYWHIETLTNISLLSVWKLKDCLVCLDCLETKKNQFCSAKTTTKNKTKFSWNYSNCDMKALKSSFIPTILFFVWLSVNFSAILLDLVLEQLFVRHFLCQKPFLGHYLNIFGVFHPQKPPEFIFSFFALSLSFSFFFAL